MKNKFCGSWVLFIIVVLIYLFIYWIIYFRYYFNHYAYDEDIGAHVLITIPHHFRLTSWMILFNAINIITLLYIAASKRLNTVIVILVLMTFFVDFVYLKNIYLL